MLEQIVGPVVFQAHVVRHTCSIGHSRHTGVTDKRVDLVAFFQEEVHKLDEQHSESGGNDERTCTECENQHRTTGKEGRGLRRSTHGDTDKQRADVDDGIGCHLRQTLGNAALLKQVAEEQHTQQRKT